MMMRMIDLFAGAGGITEGFVRAGFRPALAVEKDRAAAATYAVNFGGHVSTSDIAELPDYCFPRAEAVVGGPPCQGFSALGKRNPGDPRNRLWREFVRVVALSRPRAFVIENVPQFLKSDQFDMLRSGTADGPLRDYGLAAGVLNAADYGVSQRRRRANRNRVAQRPPHPPARHPGPRRRGGFAAVADGPRGPGWNTVRDRPGFIAGHPLGVWRPGSVQSPGGAPVAFSPAPVPAPLRCGAARRRTV